jgi:hypothetical protein
MIRTESEVDEILPDPGPKARAAVH